MSRSHDIREVIRNGPMGRFQIGVIAVCVGLNMLDGFDVLVMAFTAQGVATEWQLAAGRLGVLLSAGLVGMAAGSMFVAPWADRIGRRSVVLICLALLTLGMAGSFFARSPMQLGALRVLTGVGIGGILATVNVIAAEYASDRWRSTVISIYAAGYPIGATLGGSIAAVLIRDHGWRSAFLFGAIASAVMIPLVLRWLPESLDFLLARRPRNALRDINGVLRRLGQPVLSQLALHDAAQRESHERAGFIALITGARLRPTVLVWLAFFTVMAALYFVNSWTPRLLSTSGLSAQQGITGGVLFNLGGLIGTLVFGAFAARAELRRLTVVFVGVAAAAVALFGFVFTQGETALVVAILVGGAINGTIAGLYALAPGLYDVDLRGTGMGWAIGIGRLGAIVSPFLAGLLLDAGWQPSQLYFVTVVPLVLALFAVWLIRASDVRWQRGV